MPITSSTLDFVSAEYSKENKELTIFVLNSPAFVNTNIEYSEATKLTSHDYLSFLTDYTNYTVEATKEEIDKYRVPLYIKEDEVKIAEEIYFAYNGKNDERQQDYENKILPIHENMNAKDLYSDNKNALVSMYEKYGYDESLRLVPSAETHLQEIADFKQEQKLYYDIYTTYNDDNPLHCENSFYNNGYQTFTSKQLHEVNKDFLREVMKRNTSAEEKYAYKTILQHTPNAAEHLKELLQEAQQQSKTVEQPITDKSISEKEKSTMSNWNAPKNNAQSQEQATQTPAQNTQAQDNSLAYIHKDTKEAMKSNPEIDSIANATLELAKQVMDKVQEEGKTFEKTTRDGSKTYTASMAVKVEPAVDFKTGEPITYKNGDRAGQQVYRATAEIENKGTTLTLFASQKEDKSVEFTSMGATRWNQKDNKMGFYKQNQIQDAYINADIKAVADVVERSGMVHEKENSHSALYEFAIEANKYFSDNSVKVQNENNEIVNNAYAKYSKDDYGEKVTLYAHLTPDENGNLNQPSDVTVELGETSKGDKYALAINYAINENGDARQQGEKPARVYLNNTQDVADYIDLPEIADAIAEYKGFNGNEQEKKAPNKSKQDMER